jgi:phenylacetate-CoA ligase
VVLFSPKSREVQALLVARIWRMQGLRPDDVIHSVYGHGMINGGHFVREAALHYTNCLPFGRHLAGPRSVTQIELMRDMRVTVLVGFINYIRQLAETARSMGLEPGRDLPCGQSSDTSAVSPVPRCRGLGGAESTTGTAWPIPVRSCRGPDRDGMYVMEDAQYLELVDETTGSGHRR